MLPIDQIFTEGLMLQQVVPLPNLSAINPLHRHVTLSS
jgi:hypothetical protein